VMVELIQFVHSVTILNLLVAVLLGYSKNVGVPEQSGAPSLSFVVLHLWSPSGTEVPHMVKPCSTELSPCSICVFPESKNMNYTKYEMIAQPDHLKPSLIVNLCLEPSIKVNLEGPFLVSNRKIVSRSQPDIFFRASMTLYSASEQISYVSLAGR
jgi:hypothetical protein